MITFIRKMENMDYVSTVKYLANRVGLTMPITGTFEKRFDKKRFYEMNAEAARFWHHHLLSLEGKVGLDYLTGRGLSLGIIKRFGLGYAPESWDVLVRHLLKSGYQMEEIKKAFLGGVKKNGKTFDYFRGRAMFPIIDVSGNVVAFSGRKIAYINGRNPKYLNTGDTPVFKKSRIVFGLNIAKNSTEKELILCESNMDAVLLHARGISNAVASLGPALTQEQCRLLAHYTERVSLCYNADEAGKRATANAIRLLQEAGVGVRVITLSGQDKNGKEVENSNNFIRLSGGSLLIPDVVAAQEYGYTECFNVEGDNDNQTGQANRVNADVVDSL